jgi:hypothetical protein
MRKLGLLLVTVVILVNASPAPAEEQYRRGQTVTGTWDVTFRLPAGSSICPPGPDDCFVPALATATSDGTLIQTAAVPNISEGHGVWIRTGLRTFSLRSKYFRYDAGGALIGSSVASTIVTLGADGMSGSGSYEIQPLGLDGLPLGTPFSGSAVFERMVP